MIITSKINMDLQQAGTLKTIEAVQNDQYSRNIEIALHDNGNPWLIPENLAVVISYCKADGKAGFYDTLPDGTCAWTASGNRLTIALAPQVLTVSGAVLLTVSLSCNQAQISTFPILIHIAKNIGAGIDVSESYFNSHTHLPAPAVASAGQYLRVQSVDDAGRVTAVEAVNTPAGDSADQTVIPAYWTSHLEQKIAAILALQDAGGKDCFSFVNIADIHRLSNLGQLSPALAAKIAEDCNIKYVLVSGDTQTRGCWSTKAELLTEEAAFQRMAAPIQSRMLRMLGNHDISYGQADRDNDGILSNYNSDGTVKPLENKETYLFSLTPGETHSRIFRSVGLIGDIHFDPTGTAYYVDDTANKVRYICLNTNPAFRETNEDGTAKYSSMWYPRFTQGQFDFLTGEALIKGLSADWSVVVAGHIPPTQEIGDREILLGILNAYQNKTHYSGVYAGTGPAGIAYTNLANPAAEGWKDGYRYSSGGESAQAGKTLSNYIPCKKGDVIRIKGITFENSTDRIECLAPDKSAAGSAHLSYISALPNDYLSAAVLTDDVYTMTVLSETIGYIRFAMTTPNNAADVIVTVNQEIKEQENGFDYVSVNVDFAGAQGTLVGYFHGHTHEDSAKSSNGIVIVGTRCDAAEENDDALKAERIARTVTEQSFDVITVNMAERKIYCTKIGAGDDRVIRF